MSWWKLPTLIICVGFRRRDILDLEMRFWEVEWVTIYQGWGMSWWKLYNFIIYAVFQKLYGLDLEGLVLDVDLVISESPSSSTSLFGD